jgi:hypothetical protein
MAHIPKPGAGTNGPNPFPHRFIGHLHDARPWHVLTERGRAHPFDLTLQ